MTKLFDFLRARAENVLALMMAVMFVAFILQVLFRYMLNLPLAWTDEVCTIVWMWGILWGAAFVMRNRDDIRFDMLYSALSRGKRRVLTVLASGAIVGILLASLPAAYSFVSFMKVEKLANFQIPLSWVYSIYLMFVVAMALRHAGIVWDALHDKLVEDDVEPLVEQAPLNVTTIKAAQP
jgi:C4-dicarboxylate transporter, DctQ subunit